MSQFPDGDPIPGETGRLTVGRKITLTLMHISGSLLTSKFVPLANDIRIQFLKAPFKITRTFIN
jgi:hypothetical protein